MSDYFTEQSQHYLQSIKRIDNLRQEAFRLWPEDDFLATYLEGKQRRVESHLAKLELTHQRQADVSGGDT